MKALRIEDKLQDAYHNWDSLNAFEKNQIHVHVSECKGFLENVSEKWAFQNFTF